jgi:hypothetical protein
MGTYSLLNIAEKDYVQKTTNAAITGVVNNTLIDNSQKLLETDKQAYINTVSKELLETTGIHIDNAKLLKPDQQYIVNNAHAAATEIVNAKLDGTLTDKNLNQLTNYNGNESLKYSNSPIGKLAANINELSDSQSALLKSNVSPLAYSNAELPKTTNTTTLPPSTEYIGLLSSDKNYAQILNDYAPKSKFLYIVEFIFYTEYTNDIPQNFTFLIHKFDRPEISVEYEEVNMYNFRTNIPKKTNYGPVSFDLHDDVQNETMNFLVSYLRRISPLFNQQYVNNLEKNGMNPENASSSYGLFTTENNTNIIQTINVYHLYNLSNTMDKHTFNNPKIEKVSMSELNMAESTGSSITLSIIYDNYYLSTGTKAELPNNALDIPELKVLSPTELTFHGAQYDKKFTNYNTR